MIIYVNGCSHSENITHRYSWSQVLRKSIMRDLEINNNSDVLNFNLKSNILYNFSETSKGNDKIFYETLEFISKCKNHNKKPKLFVIQWSGPSRFFRYNYNDKFELFNPADAIDSNFNFEPIASNITLHYMISLQEIFKKWGVDYYFINYMELDSNISEESLNQLDLDKCISFNSNTHPLFDGFRNLMRYHGYSRDGNGHPNFYGHWYIANKILEKIDIEPVGFFDSLILCDKNVKPSIKDVYFFSDMVSRKTAKIEWKGLGEGGEYEKNDIRNTLF